MSMKKSLLSPKICQNKFALKKSRNSRELIEVYLVKSRVFEMQIIYILIILMSQSMCDLTNIATMQFDAVVDTK